ncbi:hypothetical protein Leryth_027118 [Lithospermum erythrorhizon]|nr:hypothetical protein Leryth_027118 [Lithospermum erythrorhizon]
MVSGEKYGPKGQANAPNGTKPKPNNVSNQKPDFDINVGLSERPPWFCSLCNTNATSKQTLQLHAEGKKHRAKARSFHAANQPPKQMEETEKDSVVKKENNEISVNGLAKPNMSEPELIPNNASLEATNGDLKSSKKRKSESADKDGAGVKNSGEMCTELGTGEVIQLEKPYTGKEIHRVKKAKHSLNENRNGKDLSLEKEGKKIKWKKLITSVLKSNPDGKLKFKKLKSLVLKSLNEAAYKEDESQITNTLEKKINSSSKFTVDGKYVTLIAKK